MQVSASIGRLIALAALFVPSVALAQQPATAETGEPNLAQSTPGGARLTDSESPRTSEKQTGRVELKRWNTSRGTSEESTQTNLRLEAFLDGTVDLLRLDLPFPDEETDFSGSPFSPRMGDIKVRTRFRAVKSGELSFSSFVEAIFPTAADDLGSGKYQLSAGLRMLARVSPPFLDPATHRMQFEAQVSQVNSVAGDPDRKDINATKFEFTLYDLWHGRYTMKVKLKPNVDWIQDKTGAVAEMEIGMLMANWRTWLMAGRRAWGPSGIQATYDTRVELGLARTY